MFHFGAGFSARHSMPAGITIFLRNGHLGVALFFILSGFILGYTYKGNLQTACDVSKFAVARVARLYPVYLATILAVAVISHSFPHGRELWIFFLVQSWTPAISNSGYTWNMEAWTLSVEAFFYVCFPLLCFFLRRRYSPALLWPLVILLAALCSALRIPLVHPGIGVSDPNRGIFLPLLCLPEFLLGLLLAEIYLQKKSVDNKIGSSDWITLAGLLPALLVLGATEDEHIVSLAAVFCFVWSLWRLADGKGWLTSLLSSRPMLLLGGASYAVYLMQGQVRLVLRRALAQQLPGFDAILSPIVLVALACIVYLFYEEPMRRAVRQTLSRML